MSQSPLETLKILDFSTLLPGPYATMMLADLGADVIRIEAPGRVDLTRVLPPFDSEGNASQHAVLNRSKKSLGLDLKKPGAAEIVKKLILDGGYHIIVEQFRPGVMDRLGVGYETLSDICPDLIYCSLTGYGQDGPYRDRAGHDLNYLALSGLLSYHGRAGDTPAPLPMQVADVGAGSLHLVIGLLSAVIRRGATGQGGRVDISMLDGSLAWNNIGMAMALIGGASPQPEETFLNGGSFYDLYRTKDDRLLSVGSLEPKFWQRFCQAIGREELFEAGTDFHPAAQKAIKPAIEAAILTKTLDEWVEIFSEIDACVEPVLSSAEAAEHPQVQARNMIVEVPQHQSGTQPQVGTPIKLSNHTPVYAHTGAKLGQHTLELLRSIGFSDAEIQRLIDQKTIHAEER